MTFLDLHCDERRMVGGLGWRFHGPFERHWQGEADVRKVVESRIEK